MPKLPALPFCLSTTPVHLPLPCAVPSTWNDFPPLHLVSPGSSSNITSAGKPSLALMFLHGAYSSQFGNITQPPLGHSLGPTAQRSITRLPPPHSVPAKSPPWSQSRGSFLMEKPVIEIAIDKGSGLYSYQRCLTFHRGLEVRNCFSQTRGQNQEWWIFTMKDRA